MAENRSGNSEPKKPEPTMSSAVLINGGATRHGMPGAADGSDSVGTAFKVFAPWFSRHAAE
jgi:hypothetical protein